MNDFDPIKQVTFIHGLLKRDMGAIRKFLQNVAIDVTDSHYPYLDVIERNSKLYIYVELPGLDLDDFMVYQYHNLIVIEGVASIDCVLEKVNYLRMERQCKFFRRIVRFPYEHAVNSKALLKDGVLSLEFVMSPEVK